MQKNPAYEMIQPQISQVTGIFLLFCRAKLDE